MALRINSFLSVVLLATFSQPVLAQTIPDASARYPETQPRLPAPPPSPQFKLDGAPLPTGAKAGGERFVLNAVRFKGNSVLSEAALNEAVKPYVGNAIDLAGLQEVANAVSTAYRDAGYSFARAYLPNQDVANGVVLLDILEGRFGEVSATIGDDNSQRTAPEVQGYLSGLQSGQVMSAHAIERASLILNDLPGYTVVPIVRPGAQVGTGDLEVRMVEAQQLRVSAGIDNHGSRNTGLYRGRIDVARSRNFVFGDEIRVTGLLTDGDTGMVSLNYALPLASNGLRLDLGAVHSQYELSGDWLTGQGYKGDANIVHAQLSYPIIRSHQGSLSVSAGMHHKRYENEIGMRERYTINALPVALNFDARDALFGGGLTYGSASMTGTRVGSSDPVNPSRDRSANKFNLDLVRVQRVTDQVQTSARFSGQHTSDNIDATEFISIAGPHAVRAYPVGEYSGHRGWAAQLEMSYAIAGTGFTPYVFYDRGYARNFTSTLSRTLSGYGVGTRFSQAGWYVDLVAAWNGKGGRSTVEPNETGVRIWAAVNKRF